MSETSCIFCEISSGNIPGMKVYEDDTVFAILDINPLTPGHTLVIPKQHGSYLEEFEPRVFSAVTETARKLSNHMILSGYATGTNIFLANHEAGEQTVFHLHVHVIPRHAGDNLGLNQWWISKVSKLPVEEMEKIAKKISLK